jgi:oxygen-dependent protoporphyrinogen oxidase
MSTTRKRIAIAGAGISGLSAAYYVQRFCVEETIPADITIFEPSEHLGGKIRTLHRDHCIIEQGPDSFLARKLPMIELTRELGLENELTATNPHAKKTYILHQHKLHEMPAGLMLGIPTEIMPFMRTELLSPLGKARAALDLLLPRRVQQGDEALGAFLRRRLGPEVLEHIAEPLLAGIYAGDTDDLSLLSTFPQFHELEKQHRSLIIGMICNKRKQKSQSGLVPIPQNAQGSMFLTFKQGLSTIVQALVQKLDKATIRTGISVAEVSSYNEQYQLRLSDGSEQLFDAVVLAVPNYAAIQMLPKLSALHAYIDIPYVSVANVVAAYRKSDITIAMEGSGFVVPRSEGLTITACTWTSAKWLHTAPQELVLIRCYVGRSGATEALEHSDFDITQKVRADLKNTMGITAEPLFVETTRWNDSMPQYPVGHLDHIQRFRQKLSDDMPGVYITGSGYQGVGLPDCIGQAKQSAKQVAVFLKN